MRNITIRTLAGEGIGYGHYFRCLSLAKAIKLLDRNTNIVFLINQYLAKQMKGTGFKFIVSKRLEEDMEIIKALKTDLFIFDSYLGNNAYLKNIRDKTKLMLIDDNNDIYDSSIADIIYNGNIYAEDLGYKYTENQLRLLGPSYLIMKEEYWDSEEYSDRRESALKKEGILLTTGGSDEYKIALDIINTIKDWNTKIRVVIGPGYRDSYIKEIERVKTQNVELIYKPNSLKEYINISQFVITAGGSTVYEVLCQKSLPIIFSIADNQDILCKSLEQMGLLYLGKYPSIDYSALKRPKEIIKNEDTSRYKTIFGLIDGRGALNVASQILLG